MFGNVILTLHAWERMAARSVTVEQIFFVLEQPEMFWPGMGDSIILIRRFPDGRTLKVYVAGGFPLEVPTIVITVAWKDR